jgi:hypothetical protein
MTLVQTKDAQDKISPAIVLTLVFKHFLHFLSVQFGPHALAPLHSDRLATGSSIPSHLLKERHAYADP